MQCFKCLFHMDIHIDPVNAFIFVENFQDEIVNEKTFTKQTPNFFGLLVEDIKILDIFYKIQNFLGTLWASIITTYLIKLLSTGPFRKKITFWQTHCCKHFC